MQALRSDAARYSEVAVRILNIIFLIPAPVVLVIRHVTLICDEFPRSQKELDFDSDAGAHSNR